MYLLSFSFFTLSLLFPQARIGIYLISEEEGLTIISPGGVNVPRLSLQNPSRLASLEALLACGASRFQPGNRQVSWASCMPGQASAVLNLASYPVTGWESQVGCSHGTIYLQFMVGRTMR